MLVWSSSITCRSKGWSIASLCLMHINRTVVLNEQFAHLRVARWLCSCRHSYQLGTMEKQYSTLPTYGIFLLLMHCQNPKCRSRSSTTRNPTCHISMYLACVASPASPSNYIPRTAHTLGRLSSLVTQMLSKAGACMMFVWGPSLMSMTSFSMKVLFYILVMDQRHYDLCLLLLRFLLCWLSVPPWAQGVLSVKNLHICPLWMTPHWDSCFLHLTQYLQRISLGHVIRPGIIHSLRKVLSMQWRCVINENALMQCVQRGQDCSLTLGPSLERLCS